MLNIVESTFVDETRVSIDTKDIEENYLSINDSTRMLNFKHSQYTRRLVLEGKLRALKIRYSHYSKWEIEVKSIIEYNSNVRRSKGLRRFILRFDLKNESRVREVLESLNIEYELELSYQKKTK